MKKRKIADVYPLTPLQQGMYFHAMYQEDCSAYFMQTSYRSAGEWDVECIERGFTELVKRHEILRTIFVHRNVDAPMQIVLQQQTDGFCFLDIRESGMAEELESIVEDFKKRDLEKSFDLGKGPLLRLSVLQSQDNQYEFIWSNHHILMDGWCAAVLIMEFMAIYESLRSNSPLRLPPPAPFKRYIQWSQTQNLDDSKRHWEEVLAGYEGLAGLPDDWKCQSIDDGVFEAHEYSLIMPEKCGRDMRDIVGRFHVTPNTILQTAWGVLLGKYNRTRDVVFGAVVSVRPDTIDGIERMLGLFINTIPVRVEHQGRMTVERLLVRTQERAIAGKPYNHYPLAQIQSDFIQQGALLDHILIFENYPVDGEIDRYLNGDSGEEGSDRYKIENINLFGHTNYNFSIVAIPSRRLTLTFKFNGQVYSRQVIQRVAAHLQNLLEQMVAEPFRPIEELDILSGDEKKTLLYECNDTGDSISSDNYIYEIFQRQARALPQRIALVYKNSFLSYSCLAGLSQGLGGQLRQYGVGADIITGVLAEPSLEMIVALLGVLASGGAFLPMDGRFPTHRVETLLADCRARVLLSDGVNDVPSDFDGKIIDIGNNNYVNQTEVTAAPCVGVDRLAYVISTSGTTGRPKGVLVTQGNLENYISWFSRFAGISREDRSALLSSYAYDLGYTTLFTPLFRGGELHVMDNDTILSPRELLQYMEMCHLSFVKMTPSLFSVLVREPAFQEIPFTRLRILVLGGEEINTADVGLFHRQAPKVMVMNHYGPAESCIGAIAQWIDFDQFAQYTKKPTIGRPITNVQALILDLDKRPTPVGVTGELYLAGAGLGRGYLNAPELTAGRFVLDPRGGGRRLYATGDLARWLDNGTIEFLGRADRQIKIRGFRVECGEIESVLKSHAGVMAAAVVLRQDKNREKYLCAYFVGESPDINELRSYLREKLPDYMVPSYFCRLDEIPMNKNRKLDRDALPEPDEPGGDTREFVAPLEGTEFTLAGIWCDVLGIEKIGALDNFFECGGHSLRAVSLASRIHKEFKKEISLKEIFAHPVLRQMAALINGMDDSRIEEFPKAELKKSYNASSAQRRLFMLDEWDEIGTAYHISQFLLIEGELNVERVKRIVEVIVKRHDSLRTSFRVDETIIREIHRQAPILFDFYDAPATDMGEVSEENYLQGLVKRFIRPFDLSIPPLVRFGVAKLSHHRFMLMADMHHIISDGVSNSIIIEEFMHCYSGGELLSLDYGYRDFSVWQEQRLNNGEMDSHKRYWLDSLAGEIPVISLPLDFSRPPIQSFSGTTVKRKLTQPLVHRLKKLALKTNASLYMILMAGYAILLGRYGGQEDVVVGTVVAGRPHRCFDGVVGLFVNTLALRYSPLNSQSVSQFLEIVRQKTLEAFSNQDYPFEELIEHLDVERDWGRNPLFGTLFVQQNMERREFHLPGLEVQSLELNNSTAKFDLSIFVMEKEDEVEFHLEYCGQLFRPETVDRIWTHYVQILNRLPGQLSHCIGDLDMMDDRERQKVLAEFNNTTRAFPGNETVDALFHDMANQRKDALAIIYRDCQISYKELDVRSGILAGKLAEFGGRPGKIVGLLIERGLQALIGILGILKSGQAYLPIEPSFPVRRKQLMLKDSDVEVILSASQFFENGNMSLETEGSQKILSLDDDRVYVGEAIEGNFSRSSRSPAYVIYTSGSTGNPKGVLVEHRSVVRLVINTDFFTCKPGDCFVQTGPLVFDVSTFEIWGPLLNGVALCVLPKSIVLSSAELKEAIARYKITTMWLTTPLFNQHMNVDPSLFATLHTLVVGGDALSVPHINRLVNLYPQIRVVNGYGPTENTTFSSTYEIKGTHSGTIPIGKPIANSTCYVLNPLRRPQGIGVIGELCTGGVGVARGYVNEPLLTTQKYFEIPELPGERLYATGDVVRWKEGGILEYLGRKDHQVKVRGNRVETGEIEQHILRSDSIKDVVVMVRHQLNDQKELCAYIVPREPERVIDSDVLVDQLSKSLPDYMIPTFFVQIPEIPLNANGKVDYGQLPEPVMAERATGMPPQDEWQQKLARLWVEILNLSGNEPDIDKNFFRLGGHSLKATLLVAKIHKIFNVKISTIDIFRRPTIRQLARRLKHSSRIEFSSIYPVEVRQWYPLSSAQKRIHVLHQMKRDNTAYNIPSVFRMVGSIKRGKLKEAFLRIIERHEVFRTSFPVVGGKPVQMVHQMVDVQLELASLCSSDETSRPEEVIRRFIRPFDLLKAPLLRVCLASWDEENHLLLVDMHHIICDGVSYRLFISDLVSLYDGQPLDCLSIQYKDYASWQSRRLMEGGLDRQAEYWLGKFIDGVPSLGFPSDYPRPPVQDYEGERVRFDIQPPLLDHLKHVSRQTGATLNVVLLSAYTILLSRYSGREDIVVGMPTAGRTHADLEPLVGMFVNMLPIRCRPLGTKSFDDYLREVSQCVLDAFENQEYPFDELVDRVGMQRDASRFPLFDVSFQLGHLEPKRQDQYCFHESAGDVMVEPYEKHRNRRTKLDLVLEGIDEGMNLRMIQEYATALFSHTTVERMTRRYLGILWQIGMRQDIRLEEIEIDHALGMADGMLDGGDASDFNFSPVVKE